MAERKEWVFGFHAIESLLAHRPEQVLNVYFVEKQQGQNNAEAAHRLQCLLKQARQTGVHTERVPAKTIEKWVGDQVHQGVAAEIRPSQALDEHDLMASVEAATAAQSQGKHLLFLALDQVTDPHNLGACLRVAAAAGVAGVILPKDKSAEVNAVVRKVACGAVEVLNIYRVTNLARTLSQLKEKNLWVYGTLLDDQAQSLYQTDFKRDMVLVMGAEGTGLRRLTRDLCDGLLFIPMSGAIESLNVSVATGICLFEVLRYRQYA
jgi:23S rRNA (guanosine2251-2'-O)-methyltransferase